MHKKTQDKSLEEINGNLVKKIRTLLMRGQIDARSVIEDKLKYNILLYVVEHHQCTSTEIKKACNSSDASVSRKLSELEKEGFVSRTIKEKNDGFVRVNHWTTDIMKVTHEFAYSSKINLIDVFILCVFLLGLLMVFITKDLTHALDFGIFTAMLFLLKHFY